MYLGMMLVINTQTFVKFTYTALKIFIQEETRRKITLLSEGELGKMTDFVERSQLYRKHGGLNPDPAEYWPPLVPGVPRTKAFEDETVYYSIECN
jgi:hypothetical protein